MSASSIHPAALRCEYLSDPLGVDVPRPRLSWVLEGEARGARQRAYRVVVSADPPALGTMRGDTGRPPRERLVLWDSGRVESAETAQVEYAGPDLPARSRCGWVVTVWDEADRPATSAEAHWEVGLLTNEEWGPAAWIGLGNAGPFGAPLPTGGLKPRDAASGGAADAERAELTRVLAPVGEWRPSPYLRKAFEVKRAVSRARVYATARGLYELRINGAQVGDARFAPGWTDYAKRIQYQTYDVTAALKTGPNVLAAVLADGWYAGHLGFDPRWLASRYGQRPSLLLRLEVTYDDGTRTVVVSDGSWTSATGEVLFADMLMGEVRDRRCEPIGWDGPGFDDSGWEPAGRLSPPSAALVAQPTPPMRVTVDLPAAHVTATGTGSYVFDLGQNIVGVARLTTRGASGTVITLRHAETLAPDGSLYTANLRRAKQTDVFVLAGAGEETFEPRFTFHGFRYVEVMGLREAPAARDLVGRAIHDDLEPTGEFESSSELLNRLHANLVWGQRGNFVSVPTDCPQRDERLGWLGDAQVFARTASYCMDVAPFFTKWLRDVRDAQSVEGAFPDVAPRAVMSSDGAPGWGDAGVLIPWTLYEVYGDTRILAESWASMEAWMRYMGDANPDGLRTRRLNMNFGDWLSVGAETPRELLATAYYALDAGRMARAADVLGKRDEAAAYRGLFERIRRAFVAAYVSGDGRVAGETQTGYLLALHAGLVPEGMREAAVAHLVADLEARGWHLSTGFLGVGLLAPVLTENGRADVAYRLALQETYPSWGYSVKHGATTMWERWDGWTEERGFQTPEMNSFNHYAFGSVGEWLYRFVAGIDVSAGRPGFAHVLLRPTPGRELTFAAARYRSVRGTIESRWELSGGELRYHAVLPPNTTGTLLLPTADPAGVLEGGQPVDGRAGVRRREGGRTPWVAEFELDSGSFAFTCAAPEGGVLRG